MHNGICILAHREDHEVKGIDHGSSTHNSMKGEDYRKRHSLLTNPPTFSTQVMAIKAQHHKKTLEGQQGHQPDVEGVVDGNDNR